MRNPKKYFKEKPVNKYSDKKERELKNEILKSLEFDSEWDKFFEENWDKLK